MTTPAPRRGRPKGSTGRRGSGWTVPRPRPSLEAAAEEIPPLDFLSATIGEPPVTEEVNFKHPGTRELYRMLWEPNYASSVLHELMVYENNGLLEKARHLMDTAPVSLYIKHNRATEAALIKRADKHTRQVAKWCSEATHMKNQKVIPFTIMARSIAMLGHRVPGRAWEDNNSLINMVTAIRAVKGMTSVRPPPSFRASPRVFVMIYDQVNRIADVKAKKGKTTKLEKIDGGGFAQMWAQDTYVNVITIPIPEALFRLSQPELDEIRRVGPLTRPYERAFVRLQIPHVSRAALLITLSLTRAMSCLTHA